MKIAKIALVADIKEFKKNIEESKKVWSSLSEMKVSPKMGDFEDKLKKNLVEAVNTIKSRMEEVKKSLEDLGKVDVYENLEAKKLTGEWADLNSKLRETVRLMAQMKSASGPSAPSAPSAPSGGAVRGAMGALGSMAGTIGLTLGAGALFTGAQEQARERLQVGALIGGQYEDEESKLGFSRRERREVRGIPLARAIGKDTTNEQFNRMIDLGEKMERAYGVGANQQVGMVGAARKAGVQDQYKFMADSLGTAITAGLEGGAIGEYLSAMADNTLELSKGVNIDDGSLRGFAGALTSLPFFKSNPERAFDALKGMDRMFKGGDRFQEALSLRAIGEATGMGGLDPATAQLRKKAGLFGKVTDASKEQLVKEGFTEQEAATLTADSSKIVQSVFDQIIKTGESRTMGGQAQRFQEALNIEPGAAMEIFRDLKRPEKERTLSQEKIQEMLKGAEGTAESSMQERISKTYEGFSKDVLDASVKIDEAIERLEQNIGGAVGKFVVAVDKEIASLDKLAAGVAGLAAILAGKESLEWLGVLKGGGKEGGGGILGDLLKGGTGQRTGEIPESFAGKLGGKLGKMGDIAMGKTGASKWARAGAGLGSALSVAGAGLAGWELGSEVINPMIDTATKKTTLGTESNIVERGMGKISNLLGFMSDEEYDVTFGEGKAIKGLQPGKGRKGGLGLTDSEGIPMARPDEGNTDALNKNTDITSQLTSAITNLASILGVGGGGGPRMNNTVAQIPMARSIGKR